MISTTTDKSEKFIEESNVENIPPIKFFMKTVERVAKKVEELLAVADSELTQQYDVDNELKTMEVHFFSSIFYFTLYRITLPRM